MLGTPIPNVASPKGDTCSFTIYGNSKRMGEIMTPTYPGTYPKNMLCSYKFIGERTKSTLSHEKLSSSNMNPSRATLVSTKHGFTFFRGGSTTCTGCPI